MQVNLELNIGLCAICVIGYIQVLRGVVKL